jgi:hypothetical protein
MESSSEGQCMLQRRQLVNASGAERARRFRWILSAAGKLRKVALGVCTRDFGTPALMSTSCVRCPVLRVGASRPRWEPGMIVQDDVGAAVEAGFKDVLEATGKPGDVFTREQMRHGLSRLVVIRPGVSFSKSGCYIGIADQPISGEGPDLDAAMDDLVSDLREYAAQWHEHFQGAPNHRDNWGLVMLTDLSTDEQLRDWMASL